MDFFSSEAGQKRRNWLDAQLGGMWEYVPPELRPWMGVANEMNPVTSMERAGGSARAVADPNVKGWDKVAAVGDTASNMANAIAPVMLGSSGAVPAANAVEEALMGFSAASPMAYAARDFVTDEFGGVKVWTGGTGDPIKAASDRGAWFAETPDLAKEYAGQGGRVLSAEIDPRNPIAFRHAEQRRPIGDVISTALEGAGQGANFEAARPIVERLYQRYGAEPRALFEYWNNDKDVADLFRALGYDAISAAEKADMKAATWAALDPSIVKMDATNPNTLGFRAYHGSPHDFDRFSLDKIGTGEGAQAYGHGLYFAENEAVAQGYRDALAPGMGDGALRAIGISDGDLRTMRQFTQSSVDPDIALRDWLGWTGKRETPELRAAFMQEWNGRNPGRMYEVQINADPNDFLDWDKPLSEQPARLQNLWADYTARNPQWTKPEEVGGQYANPTGKDFLGAYGEDVPHDPNDMFNYRRKFTEDLSQAGIPGIKYLDAGSRGAGDGSRNYVVFDDKLIEILRKYGLVPGMIGAGAYGMQPTEAQAGQ